ncbi:MAG: toll/interleukin-1 receptor domain-containing protein [Methylococcaceae bacterium]|nr:toll/interleukin-1 receptor domain-containing protein [Methylococcaceae bacterium]
MSKLKLFVSHSSRLDDVEHRWTDKDRNWRLLGETCRAIREHYKDKVDVLVDRDGLIPGEDWNHQLNVWLAECHVAIILFSKRAIEKSHWVAKEAAILSWRRELDSNFDLIPVLLKGETRPEDLDTGIFRTLKIDISQCIREAENAAEILEGLVRKLGTPEKLSGQYPQTPLELIQAAFAPLLAEDTIEAQLETVLAALGIEIGPEFSADKKQHYAYLVTKHLFREGIDHFSCFKEAIDHLIPGPPKELVEKLFAQIRSLWVDPAAAAAIPCALGDKRPLAMKGRFLTFADTELKTENYTIDRYIERGWVGSNQIISISVDDTMNIDQIKENIRFRFYGTVASPSAGISEDKMNRRIDQIFAGMVLFVQSPNSVSGLPDPRFIGQLRKLHGDYNNLIILLQAGETLDILPDYVKAVLPPLNLESEEDALLGERLVRTFLNKKYA